MLINEIAEYLHGQGVGIYNSSGVTGDIFICTLPSTPDNCIAIFPTGGYKTDGKHGYDTPTIQIVVRGTEDPRTALERANTIYNLLHGFRGQLITNGLQIINCLGIQSAPNHIGQDEVKRHEFSLNFELHIKMRGD